MTKRNSLRNIFIAVLAFNVVAWRGSASAAASPVKEVEWQPLAAQIQRLFEAMDYLGSPVDPEIKARFEKLSQKNDAGAALEAVQKLLDPLCLLSVEINPESRVKVARGTAAAELV